jgi:tetratricopeptide (TPR) repeat protein
MDSLIVAAARALAAGDALGALNRVALRPDPPALALRGIAMAQLGEYARARQLLKAAARGCGAREGLARARCIVAEAEVALAMRDFSAVPRSLETAAALLAAHADRANATQAFLILARRYLLLGRFEQAATVLRRLDVRGLPPSREAVAELTRADIALRALDIATARVSLGRAHRAAERSGVAALIAEVAKAQVVLERPAARCRRGAVEQTLRLGEVAALLDSNALIVDACRRGARAGNAWRPLTRRPVLLALLRALGDAWPRSVERNALIASAFRVRRPNESHRARLRVEIARLRRLLVELARIDATADGYVLTALGGREVIVLMPPIDGEQASLLALLSDQVAWSTSALALALGTSQRTVQRALLELERAGRVRALGRARARRWLSPPLTEFTTLLLLPAALPFA